MIENASIYKKLDKYIIHSESLTTAGLGIASGPFIILDADVSDNELFENIVSALKGSAVGVKHPINWTEYNKYYFSSIQEKSLKSLHNKCVLLLISVKDNIATLSPTINLGSKNGFELIKELVITIPTIRLKDSLSGALSLCK